MRGGIFSVFVLLVGGSLASPAAAAAPLERAPACTRTGTGGSDVLTGTSGRDVLCGLGGNDVLKGLAGNDILRGGSGSDTLLGGRGADDLSGGTGRDLVRYDDHTAAVVVTIGSLANDGAAGEHDNVRADVERVWGGPAADRLIAGSPAAELRGLAGGDRLTGGPARDVLIGDGGNDVLNGKGSGDVYRCGAGTDTYTLGAGDSLAIDCELQAGNQPPSGLGFDGNGEVLENQPAGTLVDTLNASDPDPGDVVTFSLVPGVLDNAKFTIVGNELRTAVVLDHEADAELDIRVKLTDSHGATFLQDAFVLVLDDGSAPPVAGDDAASGNEDTQVHVPFSQLLANDTDPDVGDLLQVVAVSAAVNGTVLLEPADDRVAFTPATNACGTAGFDYAVSDGQETDFGHVTVTLTCVNDAPVAVDDQVIADEDLPVFVPWAQLLANDIDVDEGDTLSVLGAGDPVNGSLTQDGNGVMFTPTANFCGIGGFTYGVFDNADATDGATVSVFVNCTNDAPTGVVDRAHAVTGNVGIEVPAPGLLAGVADLEGDAVAVTAGVGSSANGGEFLLHADGSYIYLPPAGFEGSDSFVYQVCDDSDPSLCDAATVNLTVSGMVWFVDNSAAPGDGRLTTPFSSLAALAAVNNGAGNNPGPGDTIFVGNVGGAAYTGPLTLLPGQKLIGAGSSVPLATAAGLALAPDSISLPATGGPAPEISSVGNTLTLATNNTLRGFRVGGAHGPVNAYGIRGTSFGTLTVSEVSVVGSGGALSFTNGGFAAGAAFTQLEASGTTSAAVSLFATSGNLALGTGILASDGSALSLNNGSGAVTFAGEVLGFGTQPALIVVGWAGVVTVTGVVEDFAGDGIVFANSMSGQLRLLGGVHLTATSGTAFTAAFAGAVEVTGPGNTINAVGARAISLQQANIGPNGLTFRSVSSSGSGTQGIFMFDVAGSGGLTVTGDGTPGSGGTISGATEPGLLLQNTRGPSLTRMTIQDGADDGIRGTNVNGLTLASSTVSGNGNAAGEHGIDLLNATGTVAVTGSTFAGNEGNHVNVSSNQGIRTLNLISNAMTSPAGTTTAGGILVQGTGASTTTAALLGNSVRGAVTDAIHVESVGSFVNGVIQDSVVGEAGTAGSGSSSGSGISVTGVSGGTTSVRLQGNQVRQYAVFGILLQTSQAAPTLNARVLGNIVANPTGTAVNGLHVRAGLGANDGGTLCLEAAGNSLVGSAGPGLDDFRLRQLGVTAFRLPGYAGANNNTGAVVAFFLANNPNGGFGSAVFSDAPGFVGGASCSTP